MALLRWYGSPGFFDGGLQLICIFWSLVSHFLIRYEMLVFFFKLKIGYQGEKMKHNFHLHFLVI